MGGHREIRNSLCTGNDNIILNFIYEYQLEGNVFHRSFGDDHHLQSLHTHTRATLSVPITISP